MMQLQDIIIAINDLGCVGLPLSVEFGHKRSFVGFVIKQQRIKEPKAGNDFTRGTTQEKLGAAKHLTYTSRSATGWTSRTTKAPSVACCIRLHGPHLVFIKKDSS